MPRGVRLGYDEEAHHAGGQGQRQETADPDRTVDRLFVPRQRFSCRHVRIPLHRVRANQSHYGILRSPNRPCPGPPESRRTAVLSLPVARPPCPTHAGFRPEALRPTLSGGWPFSGALKSLIHTSIIPFTR